MAYAFHSCAFSLSLFFFPATVVDFSPMNSALVHCSRDLQTLLFSNFFIKNESYGIIHIFKNYFATIFSIFNKNKLYRNGPLANNSLFSILLRFLSSPFFCNFFLLFQ